MTTALSQFLDPAMLGQYAGIVFLFFYFDRRTRRVEEKLERILGFMKGPEGR